MKAFVRGAAVLLTTAATLISAAASAQDKTVLTTDREKASYMVGSDIAQSIAPVAPDLDIAAFQRAVDNAFAGKQPLITETEAKTVGQSLMLRIASRDAKVPEVAKDKVGYLVGADVGRSLAPIKDELEVPVLMQAIRTSFAKGKPLLSEAELATVRQAFQLKVQNKMMAQVAALGEKNRSEGSAFLTQNKATKGVFTTGSGLQYMVLRQGAGPRPKATDRVRVNYRGTLLDGTEFDSSYGRGQPAEFALNQVIAGWTEGVSMMPVGSKFKFWVPGDLAYGPKGMPQGGIGPNATLVFEVELMAIL